MYKAKNFDYLLNGTVNGLSNSLLQIHFKLYEGLVDATNGAFTELDKAKKDGVQNMVIFSSLQKQFSFFFNGMRLHELYFGVMAGPNASNKSEKLLEAINKNFGSFEKWKENFMAIGNIPGVGFSVLCYDKSTGKMFNTWINEFNTGELINVELLLVMDMWEHSYLCEFGLDLKKYQETFLKNVNWSVVSDRHEKCLNSSQSGGKNASKKKTSLKKKTSKKTSLKKKTSKKTSLKKKTSKK